jgi:hypothetical protein
MIKLFFKQIFYLIAIILILPEIIFARNQESLTDWYIKDFQSTITVNKDSSLLVEEKIIADAGNLPNKHGIFRIIPTQIKTTRETIKTPVKLVGITDFDDNKIPYSTITDNFNRTITWKIGNADKTVTGENQYKITYLVKNAVRSSNADFDEIYWNILGNFWDIDIEKFSVDIVFPDGIDQTNSETYVYSGNQNFQHESLENHEWIKKNILRVASKQMIYPRTGITASVTFPKGKTIFHLSQTQLNDIEDQVAVIRAKTQALIPQVARVIVERTITIIASIKASLAQMNK